MEQRPKAVKPQVPEEWDRFEKFAKRLLAVPVGEVRERQEQRENDKGLRRCQDKSSKP